MILAVLLWALALACGWATNQAVDRMISKKPLLPGPWFPARRRGFFLLTGMMLATVLTYWRLGTGASAFLAVVILACLLALAVTDQQCSLLPDKLVLTLAVLAALWIALHFTVQMLWTHLAAALVCGGVFYLLALVVKGAVGGGDIKLMACCGLLLGPGDVFLMAVFAFVAAGLVAAVLLMVRKKSLKDAISLGPYICLGTALSLLFAPTVWTWYWGILLA